MEKTETAHILTALSACYPSSKVTQETARTYHRLLSDLPYSDVLSACETLMRVETFFPSPAKIRRQVMASRGLLAVDVHQAWGMITAKIAEHGRTKYPEFGNAIVNAAVKQIGWRHICDSDNEGVLRAQFTKTYLSLAEQHDRSLLSGSAQPALPGGVGEALKAAQTHPAGEGDQTDEAFAT